MQTIRKPSSWAVALACLVSLGGGVLVSQNLLADKQPTVVPTTKITTPEPQDAREGIDSARDLSAAFRKVAKSALPSIVSIETVGKAAQVKGLDLDSFGEGSPFGDFFKNDPRFKEMLKQRSPQQAPRSHGMGSGFIIDADGIVLTNNHVVSGAESVKVKLSDGREFVGKDIRTDPRSDLAVVRFDAPKGLKPLVLGNSDQAEIGDWVLAVGSPFGLDLTVTAGIISAKGRGVGINEREDFLQTDAAINPGNSGGPLLNLDGEVIGINTAISSRSGGYDGVGFAIPVNMVHWVSRQLVEKGSVSRGYLGVGIQPVDSQLAEQFNVSVNHGAIVTQVMPNSPAAEAKLQPGDVIVNLNGKAVETPRNLQGIVEQLDLGKAYPLHVLRDGKTVELSIKVVEMPKDFTVPASLQKEEQSSAPKTESFDELGLEVQDLNADLAKQLGFAEDVQGVVISSVKDDSPAANSGLRTGMVVEKVASKKVTTAAEFRDALKGVSVEKGVLLLIRSTQGTQFVVVKPS